MYDKQPIRAIWRISASGSTAAMVRAERLRDLEEAVLPLLRTPADRREAASFILRKMDWRG